MIALHALAFWGLLRMNLIAVPASFPVLSVSLLQPTETIKPNPQVVPPKPKPAERRPTPVQQPIQLAAPAARLRAAAALSPQPELHLRAERRTAYEKVAELVSASARAKLTRIGFVTKPHP